MDIRVRSKKAGDAGSGDIQVVQSGSGRPGGSVSYHYAFNRLAELSLRSAAIEALAGGADYLPLPCPLPLPLPLFLPLPLPLPLPCSCS